MKITIALLVAVAAFAQEAPKLARIEGQVLTTGTGAPIPRVQVRLTTPTGPIATITGDDGKFALENIPPGTYPQLVWEKTGFIQGGLSDTVFGTIILTAGASLTGIQLFLQSQSAVSGRITDSAGEPVTGAQVMLLRRGYQAGRRQWLQLNTVLTDDTGAYRIANLKPDRYYLATVRPAQREFVSGKADEMAEAPTFYPNSLDPNGATVLNLNAGEQRQNVNIQMRRQRSFTVKGKATGTEVPPQLILIAFPEEAVDLPSILSIKPASVRPDGSFEMRGLPPGRYTLVAVTPTQTSARLQTQGSARFSITDRDVADVALPLTGGVTLRGSMRLEGGDLKSLLPPADSASNRSMVVSLMEADSTLGLRPSANPESDGTFVMENIAPFRWSLFSALPQGLYVKSATLNGQDLFRNLVDLTSGGGGDLNILLAKGAASVTVKAPEAALVTVWTNDPEVGIAGQGVRLLVTDRDGQATVKDLRPGTYYAAAWKGLDYGLGQFRSFLDQMVGDAKKFELPEGGQVSVEVKFISPEKIKAAEEKLP